MPAETTWQVPLSGWKERTATHIQEVGNGFGCRSDHRTNLTIVISGTRLDAKVAKVGGFCPVLLTASGRVSRSCQARRQLVFQARLLSVLGRKRAAMDEYFDDAQAQSGWHRA